MANEIKLKIKVTDDGNLQVISKNADKAAKSMDKAGKSARTADRNLKGAAQASANGTKNFSKMAQGISGGLVPAYATLAAQVFAVSAAFQFLRNASEVRNLIAGQEALGAVTGVAYKTITNSIKEATDGQISYAEAARAAAIGTASGLSPGQLDALGNAAKNASFALGRDLTDSFNRLVRGVTKAEPELLDELGITLRLADATEEYARALNKPVKELTQLERTQAVANDVLTQAEKKFGAIEKIMDPTASSLNRFLVSFDNLINTIKIGVAGSLTPIFEFLSKNTLALSGALTLFALPIIKSILPSFNDWGAAAAESFDLQKSKLADLDKSYDKIRGTIKNLGADQATVLKNNQKASKEIFKDIGIDTKKFGATGKSGADFLTGGATSKTAQANADKILRNAEAQIKKHGVVITGTLKSANAQQVANLRKSYIERAAVLTKFEKQHASMYTKLNLHVQGYIIKTKAGIASLQKFTAQASSRIAGALSAAFSIAGWISLLLLAGQAIKSFYEYLNPVPEEVKRAEEALDGFAQKSETLNEELERFTKLDAAEGLLTLKERVIQVGNAFGSADLATRFRELSQLDKDSAKFEDAAAGFQRTLTILGQYDETFANLAKDLDLKDVPENVKNQLLAISQGYITAGASAKAFAQTTKDVFVELDKLTGTGLTVDPTTNLRTSLDKSIIEGKQALAGLEAQKARLEGKTNTEAAKIQKEIDRLTNLRSDDYFEFGEGFFGGSGKTRAENKKAKLAQLEIDKAKALADFEANRTAENEENLKAIEKATQQLAYQEELQTAFAAVSEELVSRQKRINEFKEREVQLQTLGRSFEEKTQNIQAKRLGVETKLLTAQQALTTATARRNAALAEGSNSTQEEKVNAEAAYQQALSTLTVTQAQTRLQLEGLSYEERKLAVEKLITAERTKQLNQDIRSTQTRTGLTVAGAFSTGAVQSGELEQQLRLLDLQDKRRQKESEIFALRTNLSTVEGVAEIANAEAQIALQEQKLAAIQAEIFLQERLAEISLATLQRKTDELRLTNETLSLNPAIQQANEFILQQKLKGIHFSEEQKAKIYEEYNAQYELNMLIEARSGLYDQIRGGFENAFTSIITGTKSAKQAFKEMAVSILKYIAQMIAKMLVFRLISSFLPGLGGVGAGAGAGAGGATGLLYGDGLPGLDYRMGGISEPPAYASAGGVFSGRQAGYPAVLHGTEAVVPLPNGKEIPVQMMNGGQSNNVVVNVNIDGNGNSQQNTQANQSGGANLGNAIAAAVQKELQNQKRSGGILNPYGVA